jgi:hypothetical protein
MQTESLSFYSSFRTIFLSRHFLVNRHYHHIGKAGSNMKTQTNVWGRTGRFGRAELV